MKNVNEVALTHSHDVHCKSVMHAEKHDDHGNYVGADAFFMIIMEI